ncbi:MAG: hypothetical protein KF760_08020 [Candidatus Eremiobacteraeota bacterium]|nr:hypothetical protein [Candidatus Eremiobacteraeota bacterium]MCW5867986.1 hypothetical protein [Candidatus Eremiobacteraeota bacterium]
MGDRLFGALQGALAALDSVGSDYALIGGFAAAIRGRLRFTQDLDLLVLSLVENSPRFVVAFRDQGFAHMDRADRHRLDEVDLLRFWLPQDTTMTSIGVDIQLPRVAHLEGIVKRATVEDYQGLKLRVATRDDLILLKIGAWRPIDRADAIELAAISPASVDWKHLEKEARQRGWSDRFEEVRQSVNWA